MVGRDFKLDPQLKAEWLEALKSGKYPHAVGELQHRDIDGQVDGFCCLGVLQEMKGYDQQVTEELLAPPGSSFVDEEGDEVAYSHPCPLPKHVQSILAAINDSFGEAVHLVHYGIDWPTPGGSTDFRHVIRFIEERL